MRRRIRLTFALTLLVSTACHTWAHVDTPQEAIARAGAGTVRVTKTDSSFVLVRSAAIVGDTLTGTSPERGHERVSIPMAEVRSIATQEFSFWRTVGAAYLTVITGLTVALVIIGLQLVSWL